MFTGITQQLVPITNIVTEDALMRVHIALPQETYQLGDSILLNGICSTVTSVTDAELSVEFMAETIQLTTVDRWNIGDKLNVESPATLVSKLSGSLVTGHVDAVGTVVAVEDAEDYAVTVSYPKQFAQFVIHKGSITLDGVNLTIVGESVSQQLGECTVKLIPFTKEHTTIGARTSGDHINIEFDYVAKIILHAENL